MRTNPHSAPNLHRARHRDFMLLAMLCSTVPVGVQAQTGPLFCPPETYNPPGNQREHTGTGQILTDSNYVNDGFLITAPDSTLHQFGELDNNAAMENGGTLNNGGTLANNGGAELVNIGTLDSPGTLFIDIFARLINTFGGRLTVENGGTLDNFGTLENRGNSSGLLEIETGGTLINRVSGVLRNMEAPFPSTDDAVLINRGALENYGFLQNQATAGSDGFHFNLYNVGTLTNHAGGTVESGELRNPTGGTVINHGTVFVNVRLLNSNVVDNYGSIHNDGIVRNEGNNFPRLTNRAGATLVNALLLDNQVGAFLDNFGTLVNEDELKNNGTLTNAGTLENQAGATFNSRTLENSAGGTLNNRGTLKIDQGTLTNFGSVTNFAGALLDNDLGTVFHHGGLINNAGATLDNFGLFRSVAGATLDNFGVLKNNVGNLPQSLLDLENDGTLTNHAGATLENGGTVTNSGTLNNDGTLSTSTPFSFSFTPATFWNPGTLNNSGTFDLGGTNGHSILYNSGQVLSTGTFTSSGTINNSGTLNNDSDTPLNNGGTLNNSGTITNVNGSTLDNAGTLNNDSAGVIDNGGDLTSSGTIFNSGTVNNISFTDPSGIGFSVAHMVIEAGGVLNNDGTVNIIGGGALQILADGTMASSGVVNGDVFMAGNMSPGHSAGTFTIAGHYTQAASGSLLIEIGGLTAGTEHDQLDITGSATLEGSLEVVLLNGFMPAAGQEFDILSWASVSGEFLPPQLPPLDDGLIWNTDLLYTQGVLQVKLSGDYNNDGTVDAADYVVWRKNDGTQDGYDTWRAHFGETISSGTGATDSVEPLNPAVPEPSSLLLLFLTATFACPRRLGS